MTARAKLFATRVGDALLAMALLAVVELVVVGSLAMKELAGPYELAIARDTLLPIAFAMALPAAIVAAVLIELVVRGDRPGARIALASIAGAFGGAVAYGVSAGRAFSMGLRAPFVCVLAVVSAALAFAIAPRAKPHFYPATSSASRRIVAAIAVAVVALEVVNARVLPRLYPAFHLALALLAVVVAGLVAAAARSEDSPKSTARVVRAAIALLVAAIGLGLTQHAAARLRTLDNVRLVFLARAPLLSRAVEVGAMLAPPAPIEDDSSAVAAPDPKRAGRAIDLRGRDILLVTVDALRADHVGAYGYARPTTPSLDALAKDGVVFDAAYSPTPHTSYAVTSLMTGKFMRPLVLQGLGADSETFAQHLRRYGYRTAAFYPPAVFFIDPSRFESFKERALDFEYKKVEFAPAAARAEQVKAYLDRVAPDRRVFLWVHLFEPHEPYEAHERHAFGDRDIDRYDGEIAEADEGIGAIVKVVRAARPKCVVIASADHGEEFGEHGGRYHGTSVYEEQIRVPLVFNAPDLFGPKRVAEPVQLVDLLPTVLAGLDIPRPARVRGNDLGPLLAGISKPGEGGGAFSETDEQTMLARGTLRLLCARKIGACALYDVASDPGEHTDLSESRPADMAAMRKELRVLEASHGKYEVQGLRSEGKGWPEAIRRGLAGDGDAAAEVAALLDDADVMIRRKAAEIAFELKRPEAAPALRLALVRDEDDQVRRFAALALTRVGEGAPRARDLLEDPDKSWRRLAALAIAEGGGDTKGLEDVLVDWLREAFPPPEKGAHAGDKHADRASLPFDRAVAIVGALGAIKAKSALPVLIAALDDLRLRPYVARALEKIGEEAARPALADRLAAERYPATRAALAEALVALGGGPELRAPIVRFLGTPDPLQGGIGLAMRADILELIGGPRKKDVARFQTFATSGVALGVIVPKGGNGQGLRAVCRAKTSDGRPGEIHFGPRADLPSKRDRDSLVPGKTPEIDRAREAVIAIPAASGAVEAFADLPRDVTTKPGSFGDFVVYATQNVAIEACAVVPRADDIPPPPPEPWIPSDKDGDLP